MGVKLLEVAILSDNATKEHCIELDWSIVVN